MKEAAGEANLTVVAIILIGVIVAVVTPLVNSLMKNAACRSCCTDAGGVWSGSGCSVSGAGYSSYQTCASEAGASCNSGSSNPLETGRGIVEDG